MGKKILESDYESWCRVDEWSFKDAALLLSELDPLNYRGVKFNLKETPRIRELKSPYLIFLSLKNFNNGKGKYLTVASPKDIIIIIIIAQTKQLPIPDKLQQCFEKQIKLEKEVSQPNQSEP